MQYLIKKRKINLCYRKYVENGFFKKNLKLWQRLRIKKLIRFGLPSKGRLKKQVEKFFSERGLELVNAGMTREYLAEFKGEKKIQIILLAASDIPLEIKKGNLSKVKEFFESIDCKYYCVPKKNFAFKFSRENYFFSRKV